MAKPPCPSPPPSALRALMLGRLPGYLASRCRTSAIISLCVARALIGRQRLEVEMEMRRAPPPPPPPAAPLPPGFTIGSMSATPSMPCRSFSTRNASSSVPSSEVPSGESMCTVHSPMSSFGTKSRPTIRFSGNVSRNVTTEIAMMTPGVIERPVHLPRVPARPASGRSRAPWSCDRRARPDSLRKRELSIGVSVKLTSIDTRIENAIVQPNGLMNRLRVAVHERDRQEDHDQRERRRHHRQRHLARALDRRLERRRRSSPRCSGRCSRARRSHRR